MDQPLPPEVELLIERLKSPDSQERILSAAELAKIDCRDEKVRLALEQAARDDPDTYVRTEARSSLAKLGFPVHSPNEVSFGRRLIAFILDMVVIYLADFAVICLIQAVSEVLVLVVALIALMALLPPLYFSFAYSTTGQTLGKRMMGIKVISADGIPLSWKQGILRSLAYLVSELFFLGFLWAAWDTNRQAWHDKIAGTYVVKASYEFHPVAGAVRSNEESRRQKRWLLGLGIPTLLLWIAVLGSFLFNIQRSVAEVRAMGPWPGVNVDPDYLVNLDLSAFGLEPAQIMDARDIPWSEDLSYQTGSVREYRRGEVPIVAIWALRYSGRQAANSDYSDIEAWSKESGGQYRTGYSNNIGIIHLGFSDYYSKLFWNDRWIVVIYAAAGTEYDPPVLVDKVRDVMAAHWRQE